MKSDKTVRNLNGCKYHSARNPKLAFQPKGSAMLHRERHSSHLEKEAVTSQ